MSAETQKPISQEEKDNFFKDMEKERKQKLFHKVIITVGIVGILTITVLRSQFDSKPELPAVIGEVPSFELTNENNKKITLESMKGKVWVAGFIFTRCHMECPLISAEMARFQQRLLDTPKPSGIKEMVSSFFSGKQPEKGIPVELVSFSVDPDHDTPAVLNEYSVKYEKNAETWNFLTGPKEDVVKLVEGGFKAGIGDVSEKGDIISIAHLQKLVLVDKAGKIRGYFGIDEEGMNELFHRAQHLLFEDYLK